MPEITTGAIDIDDERRGSGPGVPFLDGSGATLETSRVLLDLFTNRFEWPAAHPDDARLAARSTARPGDAATSDRVARPEILDVLEG